jgi:hypothetical protein
MGKEAIEGIRVMFGRKRGRVKDDDDDDSYERRKRNESLEEGAPAPSAPRYRRLKRNMRFKTGEMYPRGMPVMTYFGENTEYTIVQIASREGNVAIRTVELHRFLSGFQPPPSIQEVKAMLSSGEATTPTGRRCHAQGWASDGSPSWPVVMGYA